MAVAGTRARSYLSRLAKRARAASALLPSDRIEAHASLVLSYRAAGGGFAGRGGDGDLYYSDFAIRALHALDRLEAGVAAEVGAFARAFRPRTIVDALNRLSIAMLAGQSAACDGALLRIVERHRNRDGGYGKTPESGAGSTYHTFLAVACYDLAGALPPEPRAIGRFLRSRLKDDGGFGETERARRGGVNPTAAAVATGLILGMRSRRVARRVAAFLADMQEDAGGWRATHASPCADVMSTYTALATLDALGALSDAAAGGARAFCEACEHLDGGFRAVPFEDVRDVEYTFYGLGAKALLGERARDSTGALPGSRTRARDDRVLHD